MEAKRKVDEAFEDLDILSAARDSEFIKCFVKGTVLRIHMIVTNTYNRCQRSSNDQLQGI